MRNIRIALPLLALAFSIVPGCGKQEAETDSADSDIADMAEIDKIEHQGTTGGKDGGYTCTLTDSERKGFVDLLKQVELGPSVSREKALSTGAASYYTLYFSDGQELTISPGQYFQVGDTYYEFENYDELWDTFITYNSIR